MTPILVEERAWGTFGSLLKSGKLGFAEKFNLCHDVLQGLVAIHQEGMYHGDINPKNVLVYQEDETIVAKISDFSHSGMFPMEQGDLVWYQGTKGWQAPEVDHTLPGSKSDLLALETYSFALVLWSAMGVKGKSPLADAPTDPTAIPTFAYRCMESYNLPLNIKNIILPLIPKLLHVDKDTRFWLSKNLLEERVPASAYRLVLQNNVPSSASLGINLPQIREG